MTLDDDIRIAERLCAHVDDLINEHRKKVLYTYLAMIATAKKLLTSDKLHNNENN